MSGVRKGQSTLTVDDAPFAAQELLVEAAEQTPEQPSTAAQAALEKAQGALRTLQATRQDLVAAYHDALERADGERAVELDRELRALDRQLHAAEVRLDAARIGAERTAVQAAEEQSRAIGVRLEAARADLRAARAQRQAAYGNIAQERKALLAEFEADGRVRALVDEDRAAAQQLLRARARLDGMNGAADASVAAHCCRQWGGN